EPHPVVTEFAIERLAKYATSSYENWRSAQEETKKLLEAGFSKHTSDLFNQVSKANERFDFLKNLSPQLKLIEELQRLKNPFAKWQSIGTNHAKWLDDW